MISSSNNSLLSVNKLVKFIIKYIKREEKFLSKLKITETTQGRCKVYFLRCEPLSRLAKQLSEISKVASLPSQHDIVKAVLTVVLLKASFKNIEVRNEHEKLIDIVKDLKAFEVKTMSDLSYTNISPLVHKYFKEMTNIREQKHIWWYCHFNKLDSTKIKKGRVCLYYLIVIEFDIKKIGMKMEQGDQLIIKQERQLITEAQKAVNKAADIVKQEDSIEEDEGFLIPVKNIFVVDVLREEICKKDKLLSEKDEQIAEKDEQLAEKDKQLAEKDKLIEKLKHISNNNL